VAAFFLARVASTESRDTTVKSFDALGRVLVTGGARVRSFTHTQSGTYGWGSLERRLIASAARAVRVRLVERLHAEPLMALSVSSARRRSRGKRRLADPRARPRFVGS